jgi:hypothetical protein
MMDGAQWEELIKTKVPTLNKFEFHMDFAYYQPTEDDTPESSFNALMAPFHTPFWTEEKRWLVIGDWCFAQTKCEIYTLPTCKSYRTHIIDSKMITICNFDVEAQSSMMSTDVQKLYVHLWEDNRCLDRVS